MSETATEQVKRILQNRPDLTDTEISIMVGCSKQLVGMVRMGKRGTSVSEPERDATAEAAAKLALLTVEESLKDQLRSDNPKDAAIHADTAWKGSKTWAILAGKALNRDRDRDEEMSDDEANALVEKFFNKAREKTAEEAERYLNG